MNAEQIGAQLVLLCREGKNLECINTLLSPDVVSVEAVAPPGGDRAVRGLEAVRAKHHWFDDNHTIHKAEVFGPYPHGDDRFAVRFVYDLTNKPSGKRLTMDEVALYTVGNGKVTKEEFFYATGG